MRAVLDTNVLISGLFWRGAPYECLLAAEAGLYELVIGQEILEELRNKLVTKFQNTCEEATDAVDGIRRSATLIVLTEIRKWVVADPTDDKFIGKVVNRVQKFALTAAATNGAACHLHIAVAAERSRCFGSAQACRQCGNPLPT
jgi:predicted nucleic acid-binding protein